MYADYGSCNAASRKCTAVRHNTARIGTAIFGFPRNRYDEGKKTGRASSSGNIHLGISGVYVPADGVHHSVCAGSRSRDAACFSRI